MRHLRSSFSRCAPLFLFAAAAGCAPQESPVAHVSDEGPSAEAPSALDLGPLITVFHEDAGSVADGVSDVLDRMEQIEKLEELIDNYEQCVAANGSDMVGCASQEIVYPGMCYLADGFLNDSIGGLSELGLPFEAVCNGESSIKCCKYYPAEVGCHSAFNSDEPVNCEGNPVYEQTAASFGPCIDTPQNGCKCDHIAECTLGGTVAQALVDSPQAAALRLDGLVRRLGKAFEPELGADPNRAIAYVAFQGCRAHASALAQLAPFAHDDLIPPSFAPPGSYSAENGNPDARYLRALATLATRRVLTGIPNILARYNFVSTRTWTATEINAYLGAINADAVLDAQIGAVGRALLAAAEPARYKLLAVPLAGEAPVPPGPPKMGGCELGEAATISLSSSVNGATTTLDLFVKDPQEEDNPKGVYPVRIVWGDGVIQGHMYIVSDPATHQVSHTYADAGVHEVVATVGNTTGLDTKEGLSVTTSVNSQAVASLAIDSLSIELDVVINAYSAGVVWVDVEGIDVAGHRHPLGRAWAAPTAAPFTTFTTDLSPLPFANRSLARLSAISLVPHQADANQVMLGRLRLGRIVGSLEGNPTLKAKPTVRTVVIHPTGSNTSQSPIVDLDTGTLDLPLTNAEIVVSLAADPSPVVGCRPAYGAPSQLMVTELGGCHDLATNLVWSMAATGKKTWHQVVWGSELLGNAAPDAFDEGRVNDYTGGVVPSTPDNSKTNHCHSLVDGGFKDWRMPTSAELAGLSGAAKAGTYLPFDVSQYFLSSSLFTGYAEIRVLATGGLSYSQLTVAQRALCVRDP